MQATVFLVEDFERTEFYRVFLDKDLDKIVSDLFRRGKYVKSGELDVLQFSVEAAAEELFDLTNNPMREAERDVRWGRRRSISVGDMIEVRGQRFLCAPVGWHQVDAAAI